MALVGVILKSCRPCSAVVACASESNSTKAIPGRASTWAQATHLLSNKMQLQTLQHYMSVQPTHVNHKVGS